MWRRDLQMIARTEGTRDRSAGPQIYAGDFNASKDHSAFRAVLDAGLIDAADAVAGPPWTGFTWPADRPGPPLTRIDHVLVTPDTVGVRRVSLIDVTGTDHRGVIADLVVSS